jgi:hypothetical protein
MSRRFRVVMVMVLGAVLAVAGLMGAGRLLAETLASTSVPEYVNYQGYLTDSGGNPISGTVALQFSIWDASSGGNQVWAETHNNVAVSDGYFSVLLGSQSTPVTPSVFGGTARYLEVVYGATTFPRQRFASVPYALVADHASQAITSTYATTATYALNAPSSGGGVAWQYVKVVAKSGGDYTTITEAINAITPSSTDRYLVLVMPGVYSEQVTLKPYVHLKGAGVASTIMTSQANGNQNLAESATLEVPDNSQVSDLLVRNESTTNDGVALRVSSGSSATILNNVHAVTTAAGGARHVGIYLNGGSPKLVHVYAEASGAATVFNAGVFNSASSPTVHDSTFRATGFSAQGLRLNGGGPSITDSTISGLNGSDGNGIQTSGGSDEIFINRSSIFGDLTPQGESIISTDNSIFFVGASLLSGTVLVADPNKIQCTQSYDEFYVDIANVNTCQ